MSRALGPAEQDAQRPEPAARTKEPIAERGSPERTSASPTSTTSAPQWAAERGLDDRVTFDVATAGDFPGQRYDLITFFDCLHDLGDPGAALRRTEQALADGGTCMIVEPNVSGNVEDTTNPVGRSFTASSVVLCLPAALAQKGPQALGNHAGEDTMRTIAADAGLRSWTLTAETMTNRVYAARR